MSFHAKQLTVNPRAVAPYTTYAYEGRYGLLYIGAMNVEEALTEAARSTSDPINPKRLYVLKDEKFVPVQS